jgi:hypothetical protein
MPPNPLDTGGVAQQGNDVQDLLRRTNSLLESIRRVLEIQARPAILEEISKLASTPERRKIWILSDGSLKTEDLAARSGAKLRTVQAFVQECARAGLVISSKRGYPARAMDLVPEGWEELRELEKIAASPEERVESQTIKGGQPDGDSG